MQAELFGGNAALDLDLARFRIRCALVVDPVQDKVIGNGENDGPNEDAHDAPSEQPSQNADERDVMGRLLRLLMSNGRIALTKQAVTPRQARSDIRR